MKLKILTWNIHKGIGGLDRRYALRRIADVISRLEPDVALLQEVSDGWPSTDRDLQGEMLAEMTGLRYLAFAPEHRFREGGYGNAILSRFPIVDRHRVDLKIGWRKQRSALQAVLSIPLGEQKRHLVVSSVHLGLAESERCAQVQRLFEADHLLSTAAAGILAGDFNDLFGTLESRFFAAKGYARSGRRMRSFPAALPIFCLDGIYTRGLELLDSTVDKGALTLHASDHLPLIATFEMRE